MNMTETTTTDRDPVSIESLRAEWEAAFAALPDAAPAALPPDATPEGERLCRFRKICPPEFLAKIDRAKLRNPAAFDRVALWDGRFPGPLAWGDTSMAKSRAAWSALGRLWVKEARGFTHFTARRLVAELQRYEERGISEEFFRQQTFFSVLLVDDIDKINWQFESQGAALFAFYDWVYSRRIACISTTNRPRAWWAEKMGDAFARRLFEGAHTEVRF